MRSVRTAVGVGGLAVTFLTVVACGSGAAGDAAADPSGNPEGAAPIGQTDSGDAGGDAPSVNGPFTFRDRLAGWSGGFAGGFYRAHGYAISGKRLFSLPDALSPTLRAVTVVDVSAAKPRVFTLPVAGTIPAGTVEAFVYEPAIDRIVMAVRPSKATKVEIVTIAIGDKEATFTTLAQAGPASTSNSLVGPLYATGASGVVVVGLGNTTATLTIAAATATWSAESQGSIFPGNYSAPVEDVAHGRVLAYGKSVYDPVAKKVHMEPNILALSLSAPYTWSALPFAGDAPPNDDGIGQSFTVYDEKGGRVLVSSMHDGMCGTMPCKINGLWSFDLGTTVWTKLQDWWTSPHAYGGATPFLVQQDERRILEPLDGVLVSTSLDTTKNPTLADVTLPQDGDLGPADVLGATVLADGRIVSTDGRAFRVIDPKLTSPRWERFGTMTMPPSLERGASIAADPKTGEVLVAGASRAGGSGTPIMDVYALSADAKTMAKLPADGGPAPRSDHGALVVDGTLYIAGGNTVDATSTIGTRLGDVWAFERAASKWSKLATLPVQLAHATLGVADNGELLVIGRVSASQNDETTSPVFAIDRKTGAVRSMDSVGAKSTLWSVASYRGCFIGYEAGSTVDGSRPNVWRCSIDKGATSWTSTVMEEHPLAMYGLRSAAAADGLHAYFVGRHLWEAIGK